MATTETPEQNQDGIISTGISGLDHVLAGGILNAGFYLVQGDPGSGKTTLALQYLFHRADKGETGLYVSLTESRKDLERTCTAHGWDLSRIHIADLTRSAANLKSENQYSVFHPAEVELGQTTRAVFEEVERVNPRHVIFDGLSEMRLLAERGLRYRHQMLALKAYFEDRGITVLLLDDQTSPIGDIHPESLVGGTIVMQRSLPGYGGARRRLHVTKVRGGVFVDGYHDYDICDAGLVVFPRLVAHSDHAEHERRSLSSGISNLDQMLGGGVETGTTMLLIGPSGVGKSTIAMKYVAEAIQRGGAAAVYAFDEVLDTLFDRTEKLCARGVRKYVQEGRLHVQQVNPAQLSPGAFTSEVRRAVEELGAEIVVLDSLNGYMNSMPDEKFLITHLHELFAYLNQRGVLSIVVVARHGLLDEMTSSMDVSYLADTVLLLRYYEMRGRINQAISVFKKRTGGHERTLRSVLIDSKGVHVGRELTEFRGVMTGVPEYRGALPDVQGQESRE